MSLIGLGRCRNTRWTSRVSENVLSLFLDSLFIPNHDALVLWVVIIVSSSFLHPSPVKCSKQVLATAPACLFSWLSASPFKSEPGIYSLEDMELGGSLLLCGLMRQNAMFHLSMGYISRVRLEKQKIEGSWTHVPSVTLNLCSQFVTQAQDFIVGTFLTMKARLWPPSLLLIGPAMSQPAERKSNGRFRMQTWRR